MQRSSALGRVEHTGQVIDWVALGLDDLGSGATSSVMITGTSAMRPFHGAWAEIIGVVLGRGSR